MESAEAYFERKYDEIRLIDGCLAAPRAPARPRSVEDVIEQKFRLGAALKAERALAGWADTETRWADAGPLRVGPFEIGYGYQRADLAVRGPWPYGALRSAADEGFGQALYTS